MSYKSLHPVSTAPPFAECRGGLETLPGQIIIQIIILIIKIQLIVIIVITLIIV